MIWLSESSVKGRGEMPTDPVTVPCLLGLGGSSQGGHYQLQLKTSPSALFFELASRKQGNLQHKHTDHIVNSTSIDSLFLPFWQNKKCEILIFNTNQAVLLAFTQRPVTCQVAIRKLRQHLTTGFIKIILILRSVQIKWVWLYYLKCVM